MKAPSLPMGGETRNMTMQPPIDGSLARGSMTGTAPATLFTNALQHDRRAVPATARVSVPMVVTSIDQMPQEDRLKSTALLNSAQELAQQSQRGAPAGVIAAEATRLFNDCQKQALTAADAAGVSAALNQASDRLHRSPAYEQGPVIPPEQSEAEGQIARTRDLVDLAMRASRSALSAS